MEQAAERWLTVPADVLAGDRAVVEADGREILLIRVAGQLHAFDNACPHEGNPLVDGDVLGDQLECAYHAWRFDLRTGACLYGDEPATRYATEEDASEIRIRLS
ncbi:MAG TPA: Rieske (2Fe-2S) protein [Gaiellaceae bacterium]|nr:Rieske (2Fe-2S) protein [Gaiellaceae bacterium]